MTTKKDSVRDTRNAPKSSTQRYLQIAGAHDDTLVLKNGGIRAVLRVGAVNFHLKSEAEQEALIRRFQQFINALDFPVQIMVQSRKLDIKQYTDSLIVQRKKLTNPLLSEQMGEYIEYVTKLVEYADIMEKQFFVVIPTDPARVQSGGVMADFLRYVMPEDSVLEVLKRRSEFLDLKKELDARVNVVTTSVEGMGLPSNRLKTEEIIELMYSVWNPSQSRQQRFAHSDDLSLADPPEDQIIELND